MANALLMVGISIIAACALEALWQSGYDEGVKAGRRKGRKEQWEQSCKLLQEKCNFPKVVRNG